MRENSCCIDSVRLSDPATEVNSSATMHAPPVRHEADRCISADAEFNEYSDDSSSTADYTDDSCSDCDVLEQLSEDEQKTVRDGRSKLEFVLQAIRDGRSFEQEPMLPEGVYDALNWQSQMSSDDIIAFRESVLARLEASAKHMWQSGACISWLASADSIVQKISASVCGPFLEALVFESGYHDAGCPAVFKHGGRLVGKLDETGCGTPHQYSEHQSLEGLAAGCLSHNQKLLSSLRQDEHSHELFNMTSVDARLNRMTEPVPSQFVDLSSIRLAKRFCVDQGLKADGSKKLRAVDDMTHGGQNPCTQACEKLHTEGVDLLFLVMQQQHRVHNVLPCIWKADIDSAYRRVPIDPLDRWAAWIAFLHDGVTYVARHNALPFGATSAVHGWNRVGECLAFLARRYLKIPVLRFVDDFFSSEPPSTAAHAASCFTRFVELLLGSGAVAAHKTCWGQSLEVLGLNVSSSTSGVCCMPSPNKVTKWIGRLHDALDSNKLLPGQASKLAGALNWASQHMFKRLGRALIYPLYRQQRCRSGRLSKSLRMCLQWWLEVLQLELTQETLWHNKADSVVQLFCDARGFPARLAAIIIIDDKSFYTDYAPTPELMHIFRKRSDNQIMGTELLSVALGLCTFRNMCQGRTIRVWSDNKGAEHGMSRGTARSFDHGSIVHCIWKYAACIDAQLRIDRVPSEFNLADLPSREDYRLLKLTNTTFIEPVLDDMFHDPQQWESLSLKSIFGSLFCTDRSALQLSFALAQAARLVAHATPMQSIAKHDLVMNWLALECSYACLSTLCAQT